MAAGRLTSDVRNAENSDGASLDDATLVGKEGYGAGDWPGVRSSNGTIGKVAGGVVRIPLLLRQIPG